MKQLLFVLALLGLFATPALADGTAIGGKTIGAESAGGKTIGAVPQRPDPKKRDALPQPQVGGKTIGAVPQRPDPKKRNALPQPQVGDQWDGT